MAAGPAGSKTVYVGGAFTLVNGASHKSLVELNVNPGVTKGATADGSVVTTFKASASSYVRDIALSPDGTALYVGGQFTTVDSATKFADGAGVDGLARVNASTGALDTTFAFTLGDPISGLPTKIESMSLSADGTHLAFSGSALEVNSKSRPRLAIVDTGGSFGHASSLSDFTAPILSDNCSNEHDYVRGVDFSPDGTFVVIADTGYLDQAGTLYANSVCDAVARFDVNSADTTSTGISVDVPPVWTNFSGGDSFFSVAIAGNVVYTGGHNRWTNNYCGQDALCGPNAVLAGGLSAFDANTGLTLAWWHPQTTRGDGTKYLTTFPANTYDGAKAGLYMGTDVDTVAGSYHSENALFPIAPTTSATPGGPIPSGVFEEEGGSSTGTPLCIDDAGNSSTTGSPVGQAACTNSVEQDWSIESNGTIEVDNSPTGASTNLCLDTAGAQTASGTAIALDTCNGTATQQWTEGPGNTLINSGATTASSTGPMCLDDSGSSTSPGPLQILNCNGGLNQVWPLPVAQGPPAPPATGEIFSQNTQKSTQVICLDNNANSLAAGNKVQIWTCTGDANQIWNLDDSTTPGEFTIQIGASHCLDSANSTQSGTVPVVLEPCVSGSPTQQWTVGPNYSLVNVGASGLNSTSYCLDDNGFNTVNGQPMQLYACNGGSNQSWRLPAV